MTKHVSKAGKVDPGDRVTLPVKIAGPVYKEGIWDADLNSSRTKFRRRKMFISVELLTKYVVRIFQNRSKAEIPGLARRKELLSRSKLKQAFLIDSDAELFMYLIQCIRFASWKVRRLNRALDRMITWLVKLDAPIGLDCKTVRFFFSNSVKKSVKRGVRVLRAQSSRSSHAHRAWSQTKRGPNWWPTTNWHQNQRWKIGRGWQLQVYGRSRHRSRFQAWITVQNCTDNSSASETEDHLER